MRKWGRWWEKSWRRRDLKNEEVGEYKMSPKMINYDDCIGAILYNYVLV